LFGVASPLLLRARRLDLHRNLLLPDAAFAASLDSCHSGQRPLSF
jgi:hypothetical protein